MTDIIDNAGGHRQVRYHDEADGTFSETEASHLRAWDSTAGAWVRVIVDHATGALQTTGSGGGGGGAATIADGADVAQGTTSDTAWVSGSGTVISLLKKIASAGGSAVSVADGADVAQGTTTDLASANTVVGILKAIKAAITGTLTVATHAVTQSGVWTVARSWTLSSATDSVNVGNFPASQAVTGTFFQATQPVSLATNTPDVTDRSARLLGHVTVDSAPTTAVTGTFFQATQPVSGTVTANQGGAPWSENITQVGGSAIALKSLPTNGSGQAALPVWNAAIQYATYDAGARAIATGALTAGTAKAVLSIEHALASTKNVRIRRIIAHMIQTTALSGLVELELHRGTAASSAGTTRTPTARNAADPAAEAVVKSLPTITAATVLDTFPLGGFASTTTLYSPPVVVYDWQEAGETKTYILRAGVLESFVLNVISSAAHNLTMAVAIDFTEE